VILLKDVIIVGAGKAGYLHYNSYLKLKEKGSLYIVDIKNKTKYFENIKIYSSIEEVIEMSNLNPNNIIVDICAPYKCFIKIINNCLRLGLYNILVEKPFIIEENFFDNKEKLNIYMIQNYLFSKLTQDAKKYIEENKLNIETIITNFSKNRINDSKNGRAFSDNNATTIFEIEIPHQIYIANFLLDKVDRNKLMYISANDLVIDGNIYKNHASGIAIINKDNRLVIHEGNMTSTSVVKRITLICQDGYVLNIDYFLYNDLTILKNGCLRILKDGTIIKEILYDEDDNMFKNIEYVYNNFNQGIYNKDNLEIIKEFSKEMQMLILNIEGDINV
jgi:predicted dehydrogenase